MKYSTLTKWACVLTLGVVFVANAAADLGAISEQQRTLAAELDAGKADGLTPRQVSLIRKSQKEVFTLTDGKASLDALTIDEKVRLENALERINAEIKGGGRMAKEDQNVCWRERKSGTSMKVTRCGTQAEREQARQGARDWMEKPKVCIPPGCS